MQQNSIPVLRICARVLVDHLFARQVEVPGQGLDVPASNIDAGFPATIRARGAVDLVFHLTGNPMKQVVPVVVIPQKSPEPEIFTFLILSELADLDKIRDHASSILL